MFSNRPLLATASDLPFYVSSPEREQFVAALQKGQHALLIGAPGEGKTTLLRSAERELRDARLPVAYVGLPGIADVGEALAWIYRAVAREGWFPEPDPSLLDALIDRAAPWAPLEALRALSAAPPSARILLDDVSAGVGQALFGRLRDELWQLSIVWGVGIVEHEAGALLTPPADAFFERRIKLRPLDDHQRVQLIERRNTAGGDTLSAMEIDRLGREGPGNPRQLVAYARELAEQSPLRANDLIRARDRRRELAEKAGGRAGGMLVSELEGLGPVSASDETLLSRLGWTRPRAADVLAKLEDEGVVTAHLEPREGRAGRPRKLYELRPPSEFLRRIP